jgi:hypothetical protein
MPFVQSLLYYEIQSKATATRSSNSINKNDCHYYYNSVRILLLFLAVLIVLFQWHGLPAKGWLNTVIQLFPFCTPRLWSPTCCFCLITCFVIVLLLSAYYSWIVCMLITNLPNYLESPIKRTSE